MQTRSKERSTPSQLSTVALENELSNELDNLSDILSVAKNLESFVDSPDELISLSKQLIASEKKLDRVYPAYIKRLTKECDFIASNQHVGKWEKKQESISMLKDNLNHILKSLNLSTLSNLDTSSVRSGFSLRSQLSSSSHASTHRSGSQIDGAGKLNNVNAGEVLANVECYEEEQSYQSFNINSINNAVSNEIANIPVPNSNILPNSTLGLNILENVANRISSYK